MKLALVISSLGPGGAEKVLTELANCWVEQDHDVSLITLSGEEDTPFYPLNSRVHLIRLGVMSSEGDGIFQRLIDIMTRIRRLRQAIKNLQPNRVLSFVDITNLTTLMACVGLKMPVVVSERTHPTYHPLPKIYVAFRHIIYPFAASVVVQTASAAHYFRSLSRLVVIPNAVHDFGVYVDLQEKAHRIASAGRLIPSKGFNELIQAFAKVLDQHPHTNLTIYGEGPERLRLERMILDYGLSKSIALPGTVSNIIDHLKLADLFVFPSHYEGFPNALGEAMSIGLPVIASNGSGNTDLIQDRVDGRLFPVGNVEMLSSLIIELISDVEQRRRLSEAARLITGRFGRDKVLGMWNDVMKIS